MTIAEAADSLMATLTDVPPNCRAMHIKSGWDADGNLVQHIEVAFKAPHRNRPVPSEFGGYRVEHVEFKP